MAVEDILKKIRADAEEAARRIVAEGKTAADEVTILRKVALARDVKVVDHVYIYDLVKDAGGSIAGAVGIGVKDPKNYLLHAKSVVIATNSGGYRGHHLACELQGTGPFMAYDAGARIKNPEFHYINIRPAKHEIEGSGILPAIGARWTNAKGVHYMDTYDPVLKDRAPVSKIVVAAAKEAMTRAGAEDTWGVLAGSRTTGIVHVGDVVTVDFCRITYMGYNTCYYRNIIVGRPPNEKEKDLHKRSYERVYKVIEAIKPGVSTADVAKHWLPCNERRFPPGGYPTEEYVWCEDLAHGLGLWLYEYPVIDRMFSLDYPMTIEKGVTMAVEAMEFDPEVGRTKLEEMIVVGDSGAEIMTKMPIKDMMIASPIITA